MNSKYKPKERSFKCFSERITAEGIAKDINEMIGNLESLKTHSYKDTIKKIYKYQAKIKRNGTKLYHKQVGVKKNFVDLT